MWENSNVKLLHVGIWCINEKTEIILPKCENYRDDCTYFIGIVSRLVERKVSTVAV